MTKHTTAKLSLSVAIASAALLTGLGVSMDAEARTFKDNRYVNRDRCFKVEKIPQLVEYDTKGVFVRGASQSWSGNLRKSGSRVTNKFNDPVYIRTVKVLEDQHYTLIPSKC